MTSNNQYQFNVETKQISNITEWAYREAGRCDGSLIVFENKLDYVHNGNIIDAKLKGLEAQSKGEMQEEEIRKKIELTSNQIQEKELNVATVKDKIEQIENEMHELESGKSKGSGIVPVFSGLKFSINLFFLLMLSIYLFLFYVSAIYKALYLDIDKIAQSFADGLTTSISVFPEPAEINSALRNNLVVIFAPFIFYAFGYALHIFLEYKSKIKYLYISLIILITLALDAIIALRIHNNVNSANELVGLAKEPWQTSSMFWVIMLMGFVVYIVWSILFDGMIKEWKKRDPISALKKQKNSLQNKISEENALLNELKNQKTYFENLLKPNQSRIITFSVSEMISSLMLVKEGWIKYLVGINNSDSEKIKCNEVYSTFLKSKNLI